MPRVSRKVKALTTQISEERLKRLRNQNSKLLIEVRKLKEELVPVDSLKSVVIKANLTVKANLLGIGPRNATRLAGMQDPGEISQLITFEIQTALNDLAFTTGIGGTNAESHEQQQSED